jgi:hypothetical protein
MSLGIGAGGIMGLAIEVLAPPVQSAGSSSTSGGTLPTASTYKYYITAINANGETAISNEQSITTGAGSTNSNTVNWGAVVGATGYKIYRTAAGGATGTELFLATVGVVVTYVDTGSGTPSGNLPSYNTAYSPGTYTAPTKFLPFNTESVNFMQATVWRRPIRGSADVVGPVPGDSHIEGTVEVEVLEDVLIYFLHCARTSCTKTGAGPNYVYTYIPTSNALPPRTLSITIQRVSGAVFGYVGVVVTAIKYSITNGELMATLTLMGMDEASQSAPTATWPTSVPFGPGQYDIEIPTGTQVTDTDLFEFTIEDAGVAVPRLKNSSRAVQFIRFGERTCTTHFERDFVDRTDYDAFKAYTAQSLTLTMSKGANNTVSILAPNAVKDTYQVNIGGQGDLVRGVIDYQNTLSGSPATYQITVKTQENIMQ